MRPQQPTVQRLNDETDCIRNMPDNIEDAHCFIHYFMSYYVFGIISTLTSFLILSSDLEEKFVKVKQTRLHQN